MRYEIRLIEPGCGNNDLGDLKAEAGTRPAASRKARAHAWEGYYGTAVLDTKTGFVNYGDPDEFIDPKTRV